MRNLWQYAQIQILLTSVAALLLSCSEGGGEGGEGGESDEGAANVFGAKTKVTQMWLPGNTLALFPATASHQQLTLLTNQSTSSSSSISSSSCSTIAHDHFNSNVSFTTTTNATATANHALEPKQTKHFGGFHFPQKAYSRREPREPRAPHKHRQKFTANHETVVNSWSVLNKAYKFNTNDCLDNVNNKTQSFKMHKQEKFHHIANILTRPRRSVFHVRWNPNERYVVESLENPAVNHSKLSPHPRWALSKNTKLTLNPKLYVCRDHFSEHCHNKTTAFRQHIVESLEKSLSDRVNESNFYNVDFKPLFGDSFEEQYYPSACLVMEAGLRVLKRRDAPFNRLEFGKLFPKQKLFRHLKSIKTCAIISSAGSMAGSKLGRFIDSHDIVMRFNDAPTRGYEVDVGSKTTIRVVNSQVITKAEFGFTHAPIFQNVTIAAWDPGKYNGSLGDWLTSADYDLFTNYEIYRRRYPKSRAFLIHPHSIWRLWQSLQMFAGNRTIRKNPPSSGFIGLALLLPHCPYVDFIEYIPSTRLNGRCHYYNKEMNSACTFGAWHPLAAEKLMALDMNIADDMSVFQFGLLRIRRPDKLLCGFNFLGY